MAFTVWSNFTRDKIIETIVKTAPKERIQERNKKRILDAAQDVFAEFGFRGASVDEIASRAGMSKPNLHYYFKRKSDVYAAVLYRILDIWLHPLVELDPTADPAIELRRYIKIKLQAARQHPTASRVFANEVIQGAPVLKDYLAGPLRELVDRKAIVIRQWINDGKLLAVDPYHLIFLIWSSTQHYADFAPQVKAVMGIKQFGGVRYTAVEDSLCQIILGGVLPPETKAA